MDCSRRYLNIVTVILAVSLSSALNHTITVEAHDAQCFFVNAEADTKLSNSNYLLLKKNIYWFSIDLANDVNNTPYWRCRWSEYCTRDGKGLRYDVIEGGFLDIDVIIKGPDGAEIYRGERETSGMYTFSAPTSGRYTYCFSNKISTLTSKVVVYYLEIGEAQHKKEGDKDSEVDHNKPEKNPQLYIYAPEYYVQLIKNSTSTVKSTSV